MALLKKVNLISLVFLFLTSTYASPGKEENERKKLNIQQRIEEMVRRVANSFMYSRVTSEGQQQSPSASAITQQSQQHSKSKDEIEKNSIEMSDLVFFPRVTAETEQKIPNKPKVDSLTTQLPLMDLLPVTSGDEFQEYKSTSKPVFDYLPKDIISLIIPYLTFNDKLSFFQTNKRHHSLLKMLDSFEVNGTNPSSIIIDFLIKNCPNVKCLFFKITFRSLKQFSSINNCYSIFEIFNKNLKLGAFKQLQSLSIDIIEHDRFKEIPIFSDILNNINSANLPKLEALKIDRINFSTELITAIDNIWSCNTIPQLTSLDLSSSYYANWFCFLPQFFQSISSTRLTALKKLTLRGYLTHPYDFQFLCFVISSGKLSQLNELDISNTHHEEDLINAFGKAIATGNLSSLKSLNLRRLSHRRTANIASVLQAIPEGKLINLTSLDLSENNMGIVPPGDITFKNKCVEILISIFKVRALPRLKTLCLDDNHLLPEHLDALYDAMTANDFPKLTKLSLNETKNAVGTSLAQFIRSPALVNLTSLNLRRCLSDEIDCGKFFLSSLQNPPLLQLRWLDLSYNFIQDNEVFEIAKAIENENLIHLSALLLAHNLIRGRGVKVLSHAISPKTLPSLTSLNLSFNPLNEGGFLYLERLFLEKKVPNLIHLDLVSTESSVSDMNEFIKSLKEALLPPLKSLHFDFNTAGLKGFKELAEIIKNGKLAEIENLKILSLYSNFLEKEYLEVIEGLTLVLESIQKVGLRKLQCLIIPGIISSHKSKKSDVVDPFINKIETLLMKIKDLKKSRKIPLDCRVIYY